MTRLGRAVLFTAGIFYLVAYINQSDSAYIVCWSALSAMVACWLLSRAAQSGVEVQCAVSSGAMYEGQTGALELRLTNHGSLNKANLVLEVRIFNETQHLLLDRRFGIETLEGGESMSAGAPLDGLHRGVHHLRWVQLEAHDPLGLFRVRHRLPLQTSFLVYPQVITAPRSPRRSGGTERRPERVAQRRAGEGLEFFGVREYQPGDDLRRIHWAASARRGKLILREFESTGAGAVVVWVDLWRGAQTGFGPDSTMEWELRLAASIAHRWLAAGRTVGLMLAGAAPLYVSPGRGPGQQRKILESLAMVSRMGVHPLHRMVLQSPMSARTAGAIVVTPDASVHLVRASTALGRGGGRERIIVLLEAGTFGEAEAAPPAADAQLTGIGADIIHFRRGDDIAAILAALDESASRNRQARVVAG